MVCGGGFCVSWFATPPKNTEIGFLAPFLSSYYSFK
jgi:hypothetical protein